MHKAFSTILRASVAGALALGMIGAGTPGATVSGITPANFDPTCKACTNFFQFADGGWLKKHPIPAGYPEWGAFNELERRNEDVLHSIMTADAASPGPVGTERQKIGDFYASCMNTAAIDKAGDTPIAHELALAAGADQANLGMTVAKLQQTGADAFFDYGPSPDAKNSALNIAELDQDGLGMPSRDYYLQNDARTKAVRAAYLAHVRQIFTLLGDSASNAAAEAKSVLATETALAQAQMPLAQTEVPENVYHKMTLAGVEKLAPGFDWNTYLGTLDAPTAVAINVSEPKFFRAFAALAHGMSNDALRDYLRWQVAHRYAGSLSTPFYQSDFNFYNRVLQGVSKPKPRWLQCVGNTSFVLGFAVGKAYVAKTFPPAAKARALAMVKSIEAAFRSDLATLPWMSPQTRKRAVEKLDAFTLKIGYPNTWQSYAALPISRDGYARNGVAFSRYYSAWQIGKIGHPVDRSEWEMTPQTVDAYYDPSKNEIVFPAGILQPPFFNANADMAANYGGIGAVIGHESTHGFDNNGRKYGPKGNLENWWTPADAKNFDARAKCIVDYWNTLSPIPGVHENGVQVEGEEIADLGGLTIAYKAFENWQAHHPRRILDGYTPEQRFFISYATIWATNERPQFAAMMAKVDVHGDSSLRANATIANMPEFAKAFNCPVGSKMVRPANARCRIW